MEEKLCSLMLAMIDYNSGDAKRIQHFIKVHAFAKLIGIEEGLDVETQYVLEAAALTHDIGIRNSEQKYGSCNGKQQELEGPPEAEKLLQKLGFAPEVTERVCWLIAHHHTYNGITGADYQILVEADFFVNLYEDGVGMDAVKTAYARIFKTQASRRMCRTMYGFTD